MFSHQNQLRLRRGLTLIGTPIALALLFQQVWITTHDDLFPHRFFVEWKYVFVSFLALGLYQILWAFLWHLGVRKAGGAVSWRQSAHAYFSSFLLKYIPGQIWAPLRMGLLQKESGIPLQYTLGGYAMLQTASVLNAGIMVGAIGWFCPWLIGTYQGRCLIALVGVASLIALLVFLTVPEKLARFSRLSFLRESRRAFIFPMLVATPAYLFASVWYILFFRAFFSFPFSRVPDFIVLGSLCDLACYLVFFLPSGLGVRELGLSRLLMLAFGVARGPALAMALFARLFTSANDLILAGGIFFTKDSKLTTAFGNSNPSA